MQTNMTTRNQKNNTTTARLADRDEMVRVISAAWKAGLIPRKRTCAELHIDQGQFSKIVNGKFTRPRGHAASIFAYAEMQLRGGKAPPASEQAAAADRLVKVVLAAWDKTEAGAQALSTAIEAMGRLQQVSRNR